MEKDDLPCLPTSTSVKPRPNDWNQDVGENDLRSLGARPRTNDGATVHARVMHLRKLFFVRKFKRKIFGQKALDFLTCHRQNIVLRAPW
jgi:hypothetical protein